MIAAPTITRDQEIVLEALNGFGTRGAPMKKWINRLPATVWRMAIPIAEDLFASGLVCKTKAGRYAISAEGYRALCAARQTKDDYRELLDIAAELFHAVCAAQHVMQRAHLHGPVLKQLADAHGNAAGLLAELDALEPAPEAPTFDEPDTTLAEDMATLVCPKGPKCSTNVCEETGLCIRHCLCPLCTPEAADIPRHNILGMD